MTNLIDVAFVLLIIFMITAPILQGGIEVQLPDAEARPIDTAESVVVSVARDGSIYVEKGKASSMDEFEMMMRTYTGSENRRPVTVKADGVVPWDRLAEILGVLAKLEVDLSLAVEPRQGR